MEDVIELLYRVNQQKILLWVEEGEKLKYKLLQEVADKNEWFALIKQHKNEIIKTLKASHVDTSTCRLPIIYKSPLEHTPLSYAQERLYFIEQYEQGSSAYNIPIILELNPDIEITRLQKAINAVVQRHEVLRSLIKESGDDNAYQEVISAELEFAHYELASQQHFSLQLSQDVHHLFDLRKDLPISVTFYALPETTYLLINFHHIAFDGWSSDILFNEINHYYQSDTISNIAQQATLLPELPIQYKDFSLWQRYHLQSEELGKQLAYWKERLDGMQILELPTDFPRPHQVDYSGDRYQTVIDPQLSLKIKQLAQQSGVTLYTYLLGAFNILLSLYSNQEDISIGFITANRHYQGIEKLIGFFVNTLVIRNQVEGSQSFNTFLTQVSHRVMEAQANQDVPFGKLVESLNIQRDTGRHPLFDIIFTFQNFDNQLADDMPFRMYEDDHYKIAKFDLEIFMSEDAEQQLHLDIAYMTSLYQANSIETLAKRFIFLLEQITANQEELISAFTLLSEEERKALIYDYNQPEQPYPGQSIQSLFTEQALRYPQVTALVSDIEQVTYAKLEQRSNQMANYLRLIYEQKYTVALPRGRLIALYLERSVDMVVATLATLKAGGAYVPLDPDFPAERIAYILKDTGAEIILTEQKHAASLENILNDHQLDSVLVNIDERAKTWGQASATPPAEKGRMDDLAYVIYTSGTTGYPKGVMVEHASVVSLVINNDYMSIDASDCFMQLASPVFDAATLEIWGALLNGAKVLLPSNCKDLFADLSRLKRQIDEFGVSILFLTKTLFDTLFLSDSTLFQSLRYLLTGGEIVDPNLIRALSTGANGPQHLFNVYGPTETTTFATSYNCSQEFSGSVPIGRSINGRKTYILDKLLNPVAPGLVGELYIGGAGVARGYLNSEQLSTERFLNNPFASDADKQNGHIRMYKTGDLARWLDNGHIEYIGRNDTQVKIRGFRIEPGEIEALIKKFPGIKQSVVVAHEWQGHKQLVAYYTRVDAIDNFNDKGNNNAIDEEALRDSLHQQLPEYMQPAQYIAVEEFKHTITGKLDYRALPTPTFSSSDYTAPGNEQESQVCEVIAELLQVEQVGIEDDFFRIGGDSILSIQLSSRLRRMDIHLSVKAIFQHKTVKRMLASAEPKIQTEAEQGILSGSFGLLPVQQWFFDQLDANLLPAYQHWNQSFMLKVPALEPERLRVILPKLMAHHDILRASFTQLKDQEKGKITGKEETKSVAADYEQSYQTEMTPPVLQLLDAQDLSTEQVSQTLTQWQSNYELFNSTKPLFSIGYVSNYQVGNQAHEGMNTSASYVFFSAHHLIIDAVSWRIIAEDLQSLYHGEDLLPKSASYRKWVSSVDLYAKQNTRQQSYWSELLSVAADNGLPETAASWNDTKVVFSQLLTQDILYQANQAYATEINDLLLTALAGALADLSGAAEHLITLEGHGRESIDATLDISRTLGWFTTLFPVRLTHATELSLAIRQTKEMLRAIPDKGIGFGPLMMSSGPYKLPPISFNYLGVFNSNSRQEENQPQDDWSLADADSGESMNTANHDANLININGLVIDGSLQFDFNTRLKEEQLNHFSSAFKTRLGNLVSHCMQCLSDGQTQASPSDFYAPISLALFDRLYTDNIEGIYAANSLQQGFIYHALSHAQDDAYRVQILIDYRHAIDIGRFKQAWEYVLATYPILRTSFNWEETPVQLIHKTARLDFQLHDCSASSNPQEEIDRIQAKDRNQAFDLSKPGLLRLHLIKHHEQHYTLLKSEHHSIADGWSEPVILAQVTEYYAALQKGDAIKLVKDSAYLEAQVYYARHADEARAYWVQQQDKNQNQNSANDLSSLLSKTVDLNTVRTLTRPKTLDLSLPTQALKQVAREQGLTLNSMLQFAWHKLISVYSGDEQTIVGTTISGRAIPIDGIEQSVGLYINTLPLRVDWAETKSVKAQLEAINQQITDLNSYAFTPLASLQKEGQRLFHSLLVYENYPMSEADESLPLRAELRDAIEKVDYPLALMAHEQGEQLHIGLSYDADLMEASRAEQLGEQLLRILRQIPAGLEQAHSQISLLSEAERQALLYDYNQTDRPYPNQSLHALFSAQAQDKPDRIAVVFEQQELTYRELDERSNQLAHYLERIYEQQFYQQKKETSLPPESLVALCLDRSLEMLISILAVLKAGAAYVPIDPQYPEDRIGFMLEDCKSSLLLTQQKYHRKLQQLINKNVALNSETCLAVDDYDWQSESTTPLTNNVPPNQLANVIYTSGTTGQPKGVMVTHQALVNRLAWMQNTYPLTADDRVLQKTPYTFDVSGWELLWANLYGACIIIAPPEVHKDPQQLNQVIVQQKISVVHFVPSMFVSYIEFLHSCNSPLSHQLHYIFCSGEALSKQSVERFNQLNSSDQNLKHKSQFTQLHNLYGPTETAIDSTYFSCSQLGSDWDSVPIGQPIDNTRLYILDKWHNPVPCGVVGELYIAGIGVARGYLNRTELTEERFIPNPFMSEADKVFGYDRMYKTGDLVRLLADGNIEYIGRNDFQIKIRGLRIEIGEIEEAINQYPQIIQSAVIAHDIHNHKQLYAYYQTNTEVDEIDLRSALAKHLPEYMIPSVFIELDEFKLSANGKLDRKALPKPDNLNNSNYLAPATEIESQLCQIVKNLLDLKSVGINDDFFRIGGDSILSIQLSSQLRKIGLMVSVKDIFNLKILKRILQQAQSEERVEIQAEQGSLSGSFELLPAQHWFFDQLSAGVLPEYNHWNQSFMLRVPALDINRLSAVIPALMKHHDILRVTFTREYKNKTENYSQQYHLQLPAPELRSLDTKGMTPKQIEAALTDWQTEFDIYNTGSQALFRIGYVYDSEKNDQNYVFFCAHHLLIDVVSWRIICADLQSLYAGEALLPKTTSYRYWVERLTRYAKQNQSQKRYWNEFSSVSSSVFWDKLQNDQQSNEQKTAINRRLNFSSKITQAIQQEVNPAYQTETNDLLLSALAIALFETSHENISIVTLEGHGRENLDNDIDLSRTIGWFTSFYPVKLQCPDNPNNNLSILIKQTKEMLRGIPDKGLGFGAFSYEQGLSDQTLYEQESNAVENELDSGMDIPLPKICFNYLGVLNNTFSNSQDTDAKDWQLSNAASGLTMSSNNQEINVLTINGMIIDGVLQFDFYGRLPDETMDKLSREFTAALEQIVQHCSEQLGQGLITYTPADFNVDIPIELFDRLFDQQVAAIYPANSLQQGFIYHALSQQGDDAYRVQIMMDYPQEIDIDYYRQAWEMCIATYPILRTGFNWEDQPLQLIYKQAPLNFKLHDLTDENEPVNGTDNAAKIFKIQETDRQQAFDLEQPGLFRVHLIKQPGLFTLLLSQHHSIADGWSVPILLQRVHDFYALFIRENQEAPFPIIEDNAYLEAQQYYAQHHEEIENYWSTQVTDNLYANDLSHLFSDERVDLNYIRHIEQPETYELQINSQALKQVCRENGLSLNTLVQFGWHKLIALYTRDEQTIVGTTVSGRAIPIDGIEQSVGLYINTLPLIINWSEGTTFEQLQQIQERIAELNTYAFMPLASLQSEGQRAFHSILVFENYPSLESDEEAPIRGIFRQSIEKVDYPISLLISEQKDKLHISMSYAAEIFNQSRIQRIAAQLERILQQIPDKLQDSHQQLELLDESQKRALLYDYNQTDTVLVEASLHQLFSRQAALTPEQIALQSDTEQLSYAQLDKRSNRLAAYLRQSYRQETGNELSQDTLIALLMDRSADMIIAILAVLKAGAAYVPIEPKSPTKRIVYILTDTNTPLILTQTGLQEHLQGMLHKAHITSSILTIDRLSYDSLDWSSQANQPLVESHTDPASLAYVIYTSGTTGQPKGVMVEHRNVVNTLSQQIKRYQLQTDSALYLGVSYAFDASVASIFLPLLSGARLLISPEIDFHHEIVKQTSHLIVPAALLDSLEFHDLKQLNTIIYGGDTPSKQTVKRLSQYQIYAEYGVTEAAITSTFASINETGVSIGRPLANTRLYILDEAFNPVPHGMGGELYLSGAGISRGYLHRDKLNQERFIANPFMTETDKSRGYTRLYKTGDRVRLLDNGNLEYLGRNDFQMKIRGYRIEPGEIEHVLNQISEITHSLVIAQDCQGQGKRLGQKQLVAYYSATQSLQASDLSDTLKDSLPDYMLPAVFMQLENFPYTPNGKVDRKALPEPEFLPESNFVAAVNENQTQLCQIIQNLLNIERVGIEDDFYKIGGDSILSIQLSSRLRKAGFNISVPDIFKSRNVKKMLDNLALADSGLSSQGPINAEQGNLQGSFDLLPIQQWFFEQVQADIFPAYQHWNQSFMLAVPKLDTERLATIIPELMLQHDALRLGFSKNTDNKTSVDLQQTYRLQLAAPLLQTLDAEGLSKQELERILTEWQSDFDLFDPQKALFKIGYIDNLASDKNDQTSRQYVFFSAHHLTIDAVSWRIIAEDLQALYAGEKLLSKTTSYRYWVDSVKAYAEQHTAQIGYWKDLSTPCLDISAQFRAERIAEYQLNFTQELTEQLQQQANQAYHTEINDLLLTALAQALAELSGVGENLISLEGHGRENSIANVDLSRTLGWFTTAYPVRLQTHSDLPMAIRQTKEMLRFIPEKGIGFSAFKYFSNNQTLEKVELPPIGFNYLGVLNNNPNYYQKNNNNNTADWEIANISSGLPVNPKNQDPNSLSLNGAIIDGQLQFTIRGRTSGEQLEHFGISFKKALSEIVEHCIERVEKQTTLHSPADFNLPISLDLFDQLYTDQIDTIYPANSLQQGFIYHALTQQHDDAYRVQLLIDYPHAINTDYFQQAWQLAIATYPILRSSFNWKEVPLQLIHKTASLQFTLHDLSPITQLEEREQAITKIQQQDRKLAFDLSRPALLRLHLIKQHEQHYTLLKSEHHSIADGWSFPLLLDKVHSYYADLLKSGKIEVVVDQAYPLAQQYYTEHLGAAEHYWQQQTQEMGPANDLSLMLLSTGDLNTVRSLSQQDSYSTSLEIQPLQQLNQQYGLGINTLVQFAWHKLIQLYTRDEQTIVGTTVSGRAIPVEGIEQSVGLYINTLPLIINWPDNNSIFEQLNAINQSIAGLNQHAFVPLANLQSQGKRSFHSLLIYENYPIPDTASDAPLQPVLREAIEKMDYPLALLVQEHQGQLHISLHYEQSLAEQGQAQRLLQQLELVIQQIPQKLQQSHGQISLLTEGQYQALVYDYNQTDLENEQEKESGNEQEIDSGLSKILTFPKLFQQQVKAKANEVAAVYYDEDLNRQQFTYRELDQQSTQLARFLRYSYKEQFGQELAPDSLVVLCLDRGMPMLIAILAVLKAGAAYIPLSHDFPRERIGFMLKDSQTQLLLTQTDYQTELADVIQSNELSIHNIALDNSPWQKGSVEPLPEYPRGEDLAYVIYTSGTTGQPKGVMIEHHAFADFIANFPLAAPVINFLSLTHYTFDIFGLEYALPLARGGKVVLCDIEYFNNSLIEKEKISVLQQTPSVLQLLLDKIEPNLANETAKSGPAEVADVICLSGGEALSQAILKRLQKCFKQVINVFGPTETVIWSSLYDCTHAQQSNIIGKPLANEKYYILDPALNPLPEGMIGELFIAGVGVARAYLNREELTQERFLDNLFMSATDHQNGYEKMYKSGDLVRMLDDGNIEYLGRNDFQVKINGLRIELGEIENVLSQMAGVGQTLVITHEEHGNQQLVAYYQAIEDIGEDDLREHMAAKLPEYMLPSLFIRVDRWPLNANGKLDRRALPQPQAISLTSYTAPRNELEAQLCRIVEEILGIEQVGIEDDFFEIGCNSIRAIQLTYQISLALSREIKVADLFVYSSIEKLVQYISNNPNYQNGNLLYEFNQTGKGFEELNNLYLIHPGSGGCEVYQGIATQLAQFYHCIGIDNYNIHDENKIDNLEQLAKLYLNQIQAHISEQKLAELKAEPINLLGWSLGGLICLEMAAQLESEGYQDIRVYLLDSLISDPKLETIRAIISDDLIVQHTREYLGQQGYQQDYIDKVLSSLVPEKRLNNVRRLSKTLENARVTLFKATRYDQRVVVENTSQFNQYVGSLFDNNVNQIAHNVSILTLDYSHADIINAPDIVQYLTKTDGKK